MAEHDYVIANQNGANTRSDLNNALAAIVSNNSKATAPSTTYAYMWWADTANDILKQRNAADSAWISILTLSTGAPLGTLSSSLLSGALPAIDGSALTGGGGLQSHQVFTSSGTWTKPAGITKIRVFVTGGGGSGAGTDGVNGAGQQAAGAGGAGATAIKLIDVSAISSVVLTVGAYGTRGSNTGGSGGAGGTSSFDTYCSATGGGGAIGLSTRVNAVGGGAVGGTATGGDLNLGGGGGGAGGLSTLGIAGGAGGASYWGGGGAGARRIDGTVGAVDGGSATAYGSGGGGSVDSNTNAGRFGGYGKAGIIYIEEFA